jgi:hypothetical protein
MEQIKFDSTNENFVIQCFLNFVENGYTLQKAYTKRRFFLFGKIRYFVEMKISLIKYKELIQISLDNEDYLETKRLTKEYENMKKINF